MGIRKTLPGRAADVLHVVTEFPQTPHRETRDVLINEDLHPSGIADLDRSNLLFSQVGSIFKAGHDVFVRERRILGEEIVYGVAVR